MTALIEQTTAITVEIDGITHHHFTRPIWRPKIHPTRVPHTGADN